MVLMEEERYSISRVADAFGLRVSALRYYHRTGLLTPVERRGGVRYYGPEELRTLGLIRLLHHQGLVSLVNTEKLTAEPARGDFPAWHEVLEKTADDLGERIQHLQRAHDIVRHLLRCPDPDPVRACPYLRETLDAYVSEALAGKTGHASVTEVGVDLPDPD